MNSQRIADILRGFKFPYKTERGLQSAVSVALSQCRTLMDTWDFKAEVILNAEDRIDFMVTDPGIGPAVGIECKINDTKPQVTAQLHRYLQHPEVDEMVLVTACSRHLTVPREINGKPIHLVFVAVGAAF